MVPGEGGVMVGPVVVGDGGNGPVVVGDGGDGPVVVGDGGDGPVMVGDGGGLTVGGDVPGVVGFTTGTFASSCVMNREGEEESIRLS